MNMQNSVSDGISRLIRNKVIIAIAGIVFGAVLIVMKSAAVDALVRIFGWILLAAAAVYIIRYLIAKGENRHTSLITMGIVLAIVGLFFVVNPSAIVNFFPIVMGLILIVSGISDFVNAVTLKKASITGSGWFILISLIVIVLGVCVLLRPDILANLIIVLTGITLLVDGVLDLLMMVMNRN